MPRYYLPKGKNKKRPRLVQIRKKVPKSKVVIPSFPRRLTRAEEEMFREKDSD